MTKGPTLLALATLALTSACRSTPENEAPPPRVDWGASDIETVSRAMVDELLESPQLSYLRGTSMDDLRIPAYAAGVWNDTNRDIHQDTLMAAVERQLLASGRFRLVSEADGDLPAMGGPRRSPEVGADQARRRAAEFGAQLAIHGVLRSTRAPQEEGGGKIFSLELACLDIASDEALWSSVREVSLSEGDLFVQN